MNNSFRLILLALAFVCASTMVIPVNNTSMATSINYGPTARVDVNIRREETNGKTKMADEASLTPDQILWISIGGTLSAIAVVATICIVLICNGTCRKGSPAKEIFRIIFEYKIRQQLGEDGRQHFAALPMFNMEEFLHTLDVERNRLIAMQQITSLEFIFVNEPRDELINLKLDHGDLYRCIKVQVAYEKDQACSRTFEFDVDEPLDACAQLIIAHIVDECDEILKEKDKRSLKKLGKK